MSGLRHESRGYCPSCKKILFWSGTPTLREARCKCGTALERAKPSTRAPHVNERPGAVASTGTGAR